MGFRYPKHVGARLVSSDEIAVLVAIPILAGESVTRLEIVSHSASKDDTPADNVVVNQLLVTAHPFEWASDINSTNLAASNLDLMVENAMGKDSVYEFGAEPNSAGDQGWQGPADVGMGNHEVLYERVEFLTPHASGIDTGLIAPDQIVVRRGASHRKVIERNHFYAQDMVLCISHARPDINAQTDFGVAEMDQSADEDNLFEALGNPEGTQGAVQSDKIHELVYGGDKYVEADTLSGVQHRGFAMVQAVIATPWPQFPT